MTYQSPLHILESLEIKPDDLNSERIARLRKKLLAEFNLSTDITIQIKDKSYSKDDVLKLIDKLKNLENIGIHKAIYERKHLLDWLENENSGTFPSDVIKETLIEFPDEIWFHLIVKDKLVDFIKVCFRKQNYDTIIRLFSLSENLNFGHNYAIHDEVYNFISQLIQEIHEATTIANPTQNRLSFGFIADPKWTDFLNQLPDEFEGIIAAYLTTTVNYTVSIQRKNPTFTYEISYQLFQTKCSDSSIKRIIDSNNKAFEHNYKHTNTDSEGNKRFPWYILLLLFWIVKTCFTNNRTTYTPSLPPTNNTITTPYGSNNTTSEDNSIKKQSIEDNVQPSPEVSPSISTYIFSVWLYQQYLKRINLNETPDSAQPNTGDDLLTNINATFEKVFVEESPNSSKNLQALKIENKSNYGVIVFRVGCSENRSFYIKPKNNYTIDICNEDNLFFYFGNNWKSPTNSNNFGTNKNSNLGYFLDIPQNGIDYFSTQYTLQKISKNPKISIENEGKVIKPILSKNLEWVNANIYAKFPNFPPKV